MRKEKQPASTAEVIRKRRMAAEVRQGYISLLLRIALLGIVAVLLFAQVFWLGQASGNCMLPAVKDGDLVIAYRLQQTYAKDDVIVYRYNGETAVGRIVALENDIVNITAEGALIVNGATQSGEIYFPTYPGEEQTYPYIVSEDQVFVLGDYRTQSEDSRIYGAIDEADVIGKVITILRRQEL